jgi:hypothetical protein
MEKYWTHAGVVWCAPVGRERVVAEAEAGEVESAPKDYSAL